MAETVAAITAAATAIFSTATAAVATGLTAAGLSTATATAIASQVVISATTFAFSVGIGALMRPSTPSSGLTLDFKPDPKAPITGMMGYGATGGNKVFQSTWGYNNVVLSLGAALSLGPIDAITQFRADDKVVTFSGPQNEATGFYAADMWQKTTLGLPTDTALTPPTGLKYGSPPLTTWGANNAAKGVSFAFWTMVLAKNPEDRNIFVNGVPDPRWIGRWMKVYDWRKDSTYPGGSGTQRENDWRTWTFSENPYVHARAWLRGHHVLNNDGTVDFTKRLAGVGVNPAAIDMPAFNEGANVADANDWKISGAWTTSDAKWDVLVSMLKAGGGAPQQNGAKISVMINTPRVSTATITRDHVVSEVQVNPLTRRRERKNTIVPRYRSESHSWEYVPAGAVTSSVYRTEDRNELRSIEVQYTYVRDAKQAAQLAAYDLANLRESIKVNATVKVDGMAIRAGDCITFNLPEIGLSNQKCVVVRKTLDYQTAMVTLECRSETDGKHAWALGQAANPPPTPSLSANDPLYMPAPLPVDWTVAPQPPSGGTSQPGINVTGPIDRGDIASVIVEYGTAAGGPWTNAGQADPATGRYHLAGLQPKQQYWISIRYVANNGTISDRYVTGPHEAPDLIAGDLSPESPTLTALEAEIQAVVDGLDNAVTEINKIDQRTEVNVNLVPNGNFEENNASRWGVPAGFFYVVSSGDGGPILYGELNTGTTRYAGSPLASSVTNTYYSAQISYRLLSDQECRICVSFYDDLEGYVGQTPWQTLPNKDDWTVFKIENFAAPSGASKAQISMETKGTLGSISLRQAKIEMGSVSTIYTSDKSLQNTSAAVTQNTITIADHDAQFALASWEVVAAASGGKPARLKVVSSTLGSAVALDAPYVYFGDNTVFEDATDTLVTTVGSTRYITAWGAPFGTDNLTYWVGPNNIATTAATKSNAGITGQWRDSSGASFFGGATLSGPFDSGVQNPSGIALNLTTWTTVATIPEKYIAAMGGWIWRSSMQYVMDTVPGNQGAIEVRLVTTNQADGDLRVVSNESFNGIANSTYQNGGTAYAQASGHVSTAGSRKLLLQAKLSDGFGLTNGSVRNVSFNGVYYA